MAACSGPAPRLRRLLLDAAHVAALLLLLRPAAAAALAPPRAATALQAADESGAPGVAMEQGMLVHVTSIGGVGTTGFMDELRSLHPPVMTNDPIDNDQIKHAPYSKLLTSKRFRRGQVRKIVYLHGDPSRAVLSVDRRGWFMIQARKTRTDPFPKVFAKKLEQYARSPDDLFQFEKHFDSFFQQCDYPIAFLRISEKTQHLRELAEFLETDVEEVKRQLIPWERLKMAEEVAEEELLRERNSSAPSEPLQGLAAPGAAGLDEELLVTRSRQLLLRMSKLTTGAAGKSSSSSRVVPLEYNPDKYPSAHNYSEVPQEIKDMIAEKLRGLSEKYRKLPGFKAYTPEDCKRRKL